MNSILRKGSKGSNVVQLQQLLRASGYYRGDIDGDFGAGTANAVLSFQHAKGLGADGVVGTRTWQVLMASAGFTSTSAAPNSIASQTSQTVVSNSIDRPVLAIGANNALVAEAQQLLKTKGYYSGRVDRDFGKHTQAAVIAFQTANSLFVDGIVGAETWRLLRAPANDPAVPVPVANPTNPVTSGISGAALASAWATGTIYPAKPNDPISATTTTLQPSVSTELNPISSTSDPATSITPPEASAPVTTIISETVSPAAPTEIPATSEKISLVDAALSYRKTKFVYQTEAIKNLDLQIGFPIKQEFINRWNDDLSALPPEVLSTDSLEDAFNAYNGSDFPSQPMALIWLENQLAPAALDRFSREWQNLPSTRITRVSFVDAANHYDRINFPNQLNAIAYLDQEIANTPDIKIKFIQRWIVATGGGSTAIAEQSQLSIVDAFNSYNPNRFPSQALALDWLQRQLQPAILTEFSRQWQTVILV